MWSLANMTVKARLGVAGLVVLLGLIALSGYTLLQIRSDAMDAHSVRIKHIVEVSQGIVANFQKLESDKKLTREEAQAQAKEALRSLRFNKDDYFWFIALFRGRLP